MNAFRSVPSDKLNEFFNADYARRQLMEFVQNPEHTSLFFREQGKSIEVSDLPYRSQKGVTVFYMVKLTKSPLSEDAVASQLLYGDISADPMEHLATVAQRIYYPIVCNRETSHLWSETIAKDVRDNFETFVANLQITQGHIRGVTCLPLPNPGGAKGESDIIEEKDKSSSASQHQIHSLEGAIITWTKQIKNVLKQDPETVFVEQENPGPSAEIDFWKAKAGNLNGIFDQLQSVKIRRVLKILDHSKSTYNAPFAKLCKEVFHARAEANNIIKYLRPLIEWFEGLESETDFDKIVSFFRPILHSLLLVWKSSAYYNTPARLVIIIREICNTLIKAATTYLQGDTIFDLIDGGEAPLAVKMLQNTLKILGKFKSSYFDYKAKAQAECPDNPWRVQNNAIFVRLDGFLERCHDILDLAQTILLYSKLAKIEVGGTKGKTLTTSVQQLHSDFTQAIDSVRSVGKGILNLENKEFEDAFYEFRTRMKELDRRLGSVIVQGFDDVTTVAGRFRLLDTFDNLITRPIVADELEKNHATLIAAILYDILEVQYIFNVYADTPIIANNLPPIAGALTWSRGLLERIEIPMRRLKTLDIKILDREDAREVIKVYTALIGQMKDFERDRVTEWGKSIEATSQVKLKNSLLRKELLTEDNLASVIGSNTSSAAIAMLIANNSSAASPIHLMYVNFDPVLVQLLREVKYFVLLGLQVPDMAMEIYKQAEIFRRHTGNLDLIVNMYNDIQTTLLPVERPLVRNQLEKIDKTLSAGIEGASAAAAEGAAAPKGKSKALNWKSNGIELFISEAMTESKDLTEILQMLKGNLKRVEEIVSEWATAPIFERTSKTASTEDFVQLQKKTRQTRLASVKESGYEIHRLIKDTNKKLKVSQGLPDWKAYVDFANNVVVAGLVGALTVSLQALACQLNPKFLEAHSSASLLEIQIDLIVNKVVFIPEVGLVAGGSNNQLMAGESTAPSGANPSNPSMASSGARPAPTSIHHYNTGIKNLVNSWIEGMLNITANAFKRLDTSEGTYVRELVEVPVVQLQRTRITKFLQNTENNANVLRKYFHKFEYLWTTDMSKEFQEFIKEAVDVEYVDFPDPSIGAEEAEVSSRIEPTDPRQAWVRTTIKQEMFSERIVHFLKLQSEVAELKPIHEIDFLRINAQPIKQALSTWVTKWLYMYSKYLQDYVGTRLLDLHTFIVSVNKGLEITQLTAADREPLMKVMTYIRDVRKRTPEFSTMLAPLRRVVGLLKVHTTAIDLPAVGGQPALDFLEQAKMLWENTVNKAYRVKESIQVLQNSMLEGIRKDIKSFESGVNKFVKEFRSAGPFAWIDSIALKNCYVSIDKYYKDLVVWNERMKSLNELEDLFELQSSRSPQLQELGDDLKLLKSVWDVIGLTESLFSTWKSTLWAEIKTDDLLDQVKQLQVIIRRLAVKTREWAVFHTLDAHVKNMATVLPLVHELHSPAMRDRHWKNLMIITATSFDKGPSFCLDDLFALNLHLHVEAVQEVIEVAAKELKVESKLRIIEDLWNKMELKFDRHRDTEVYCISPPDLILETLEEHHLQLGGMAGMGKFVDFFRSNVSKWQKTLGEVETTLKMLLIVQRQWGSLESIFMGSADIRAQLPDDTKRFEGTDSEFKDLMREVQAKPSVVFCCTFDGREESLINMHKELEKCEKALNEYLEVKKNIFPRFYFVSNAALLDILSNGNNPSKIMPHIGSVFDGISNLDLVYSSAQKKAMEDDPEIQLAQVGPMTGARAMMSKDKECVAFPREFEMKNAVEHWLNELVRFMQETLVDVLSQSMVATAAWELDKPREEWVFTVPAQIALVSCQVIWTDDVEVAFEELEGGTEDAMKKYSDVCTARLEGLIRLVQGELTQSDRVKVITVITIDVHNRDVVQALVAKKVEGNVDFKWQSQLRFFWHAEDKVCNIRICDFATVYSFEYVGNCGRLVITPLTDRCYVTLTVALRLFLGGAPAGPAGTGKTETTKDLARGLGLPCYVFNCSDQMNYQTMGDIFKGLTQVGAWGCFDEFNRIEIEVLSVIATQVRCILEAIAHHSVPANRHKDYMHLPAGTPPVKVGTFNFFGEAVYLVPTVGLFITMNPGYAGRTELPENLKALFRSCAMIQPDVKPISENMLMAEGFVQARPLSVKFVTLYRLCSELLSKQHHYDWGLRAIKSVLLVAGKLKRADPNFAEEEILMRALRDFNTPKIPLNDIPIFLRLIADLFPGLDLPTKVNEATQKTCMEVCKASGLKGEEVFMTKILQLQELLEVRHSVMLLGPAGCGKTTVWKTLLASQNIGKSKPVAVCDTVNPKSVTTDELYGYMTLSKDWKDGVLSIIMRNMSKNVSPYSASQTSKWVILDGDIDAIWIESMNTVMDDNKVLTLVSNERIPLSEAMRMVFEIHTLRNATPATVSRAGILYINDTDIGYGPYVESWFAQLGDVEKTYLPDIFHLNLGKLVDFYVSNKIETIVPLPLLNIVQSLCHIIEGMIRGLSPTAEKTKVVYERFFVFAAMWAFGGCVNISSERGGEIRKLFSSFIRTLNKHIKFPDSGNVLDYFIDPISGETVAWQDKVASYSGSVQETSGPNVFVPTSDTVRLSYLMNMLVRNERHVMFVGSAGTGKTILVTDYLMSLSAMEDTHKFVTINMNFYTDSYALQMQLEQSIDKRSGKTYGPAGASKLIYFIDDLNLPEVGTYGTQTPIALMRQHIDHGSWFDRSDMSLKKSIIDCSYVAVMNHKCGSFFVDPRLQRHFTTFTCQIPSEADLGTIFGSILNSHLFNFGKKLKKIGDNLTNATIALYKEILMKFLPSAVKFHYNFTLRDLSAVMRGLCNSKPREYKYAAQFTRLWYHEAMRVFSDRLISETEVMRCKEIVVNVGKRFMEDDPAVAYADPCTFVHFITAKGTVAEDNTNYIACEKLPVLKSVLEEKLADYNESHAIMNLVLFEQAMKHVTRITRILMFPGGHALLVGVGGSGKQSLSKLAASICRYDTTQLSVTSEFGVNDLKEVLRDLYRKTGVKPGEPHVFILTDTQITDERFLVFLNDLLSSGRIPDLYTKEEYDGIFSSLRAAAKQEGIPDNRESMMNFFISRVRNHLHVILCFSPVGEAFRQRARKFPGIINCTAIDWFQEWPKDALVSVAQKFLESVDTGGGPEIRDNIAYHIAEVHSSVSSASEDYLKTERRYNYTTPKSFLELIDFYKTLLNARRTEMINGVQRLETGLSTLMRTNKDVESLQEFLKEKKKEVESKKAATDALLEEMGKQRQEAEAQQALADIEKKKADAAANDANVLEEQAAGDLAIAKPALDRAVDAVNCLDKASMTELKSFTKPPSGVDKVTAALLVMIKLEKKDFSWENAKKMMAKVDAFKERLETYRGDDIPANVLAVVQPMLEDPDFNVEKMRNKSAAAANLCNWVVNIIGYNNIYKRVKPLMDSLEKATKVKKRAEDDLAVVAEKLAVIEGKLNKLQATFVAATQEKAKVEEEARSCVERLSLAERLTTGLASEKERWGQTVEALRQRDVTMAGDVMIAAAFTSYIGAFGMAFRDRLWKEVWLKDLIARDIPMTDGIDPLWMLTDESQAAGWNNEGLPSDRISIENGAIITSCSRWPLLIDPQLQGIRWLKKHCEITTTKHEKQFLIIRPGEKRWISKIVQAIQNGDTVIVENIGETIDASLDPILSKSVYRKGKTLFIKLGEDDVEYDERFKLYMQTKLANPHYKPEIAAQCTLINFIVTKAGLEDQLLATIVSQEEPELEQTRNNLVQAFNDYKIQLKELEDQLLERLANAPTDILSDIPLIEGLESTKATVTEINDAVTKGRVTEAGINIAREVYRVVASEASLLYFAILQLCYVEHMYQYSLDSFTMFFLKALKIAPAAEDKPARVKSLQSTLRWTIYRWIVRGLFEKHRLIFLTQLTFSLLQAGLLGNDVGHSVEGMRFLLFGPKAGDEKSPISWITDSMWNSIKSLAGAVEIFEKLPNDIEENSSRFLEWFQHFTPESEKLPGDWRELEKTPFQKLLVVRVLRPDRMTVALTNFITEQLPNGKEYVECDSQYSSFQVLESAFEDSSPAIPLYCILSPGADIVSDIDKLATKCGKVSGVDYHNISLGQGQDVIASERLEVGHRQGHWVVLNNVHLMPRWLFVLEKRLEEYCAPGNTTHPDFRTVLSSDPSEGIPVSILDRAIKITSDPPSGLKANLKQAVACFSAEYYEELEPRTKGILFGLCQFHAVMVERKKFGAKGYNMSYPFSIGDLVCSSAVLRNYMESAPAKVPWADLRYLFGEIMYGGHIVNDFDRTLCKTYLDFFMKEDLLDEKGLYPYLDDGTSGPSQSAALAEEFHAPSTALPYDKVLEHIDDTLKTETPTAFGLHPNAEVGYRTAVSDTLLKTILELSAASGGADSAASGGGDMQSAQQVSETIIQEVLDILRDCKFDLDAIANSVDEIGPFQNVVLQECERMNLLTSEVVRSLMELDLGFRGDLTMSDNMEDLSAALFLDRVPKQWELLAYPSLRPLSGWLVNLQTRISQIHEWSGASMETPIVTWICGLFNPQAFLTAVMQVTAQAQGLELDKLCLSSEMTKKLNAEEINTVAKDGTYIVGLGLEGAGFNLAAGLLEPSKPREMFAMLPVIHIRPTVISDKVEATIFSCPVYKTQNRGNTYVFQLQLKSKFDSGKWVLAGVVAVMEII